jgi:hypothetical protein
LLTVVRTVRHLLPLLTSLPFLLPASGCGDDGLDADGKPTLEGTDHTDPLGKADALQGRRGPRVSFDGRETQVWAVTARWEDRDTAAAREAGLAWGADSGLSWDEKFHAWVESLERQGNTFVLTTPWGKTVGAPALECAETAMFLRIAFASWHGLPFFIEAWDGGNRVYFGHMGIITASGTRWNNLPRFKRLPDFSAMADEVRNNPGAWPRDETLRGRKIIGKATDEQPAVGGAPSGTLFDEIFLNKRVGYFLTYQLGFNGSIHLADSANTYNLRADAFEPGDFLVKRHSFSGIGHTVVVKKVTDLGVVDIDGETFKTREAEVVSGTMPRRQPLWEGPSAAKSFYFTSESFGGEDNVRFGSGLKRFRSARNIGGNWTNTVLPDDSESFINANATAKLIERLAQYELVLTELSPEEKLAEIETNLEFQRQHLRNHPSSCAARIRREEGFASLYEVAGEELGMSREEVDREYRLLEDYVFADLVYEKSKTCCWNSSNEDMYLAAMLYNECELSLSDDPACDALESGGVCTGVRVFRAHAGDGDGYETFRRFAVANGFSFVPWSADESCPQSGVSQDTLHPVQPTDVCEVLEDLR